MEERTRIASTATNRVECLQIGIVASIAHHNWILQFHRTVNGTTLIAIMFQVNMFLSPFILILFKARAHFDRW